MKLQRISSIAVLIYIVINVLVTIFESSEIEQGAHTYLLYRVLSIIIAIPCYPLFKRNALDPVPQILFAASLMVSNMVGYYFRPWYLPSFIHSIYALAFFVFMTRTMFIWVSSTMTFIFVLFCLWAHPHLRYHPGDLSNFDIISVPIVTLIIAWMIHYFFTAQRQIADLAHIKFGTLGRLSARAFHDVKGSLQNPLSLTEQIRMAADQEDLEKVKELSEKLQNQFLAIRGYLFNYNQVSKFSDLVKTQFQILDSFKDAVTILKDRLSNVEIEITGDMALVGSKNLFTSIFLNLLTNSLDEFAAGIPRQKKISIKFLEDNFVYQDSNEILDTKKVEQFLSHSGSSKAVGSGLGIYFIREALEQFDGKLFISVTEKRLIFNIELNRKFPFNSLFSRNSVR